MVDWRSDTVIEECAKIFGRVGSVSLGIYIWYFSLTLQNLELRLASRRLQFSLSYVPYLLGRYAALTSLILLFITTQGSPSDQCLQLYKVQAILTTVLVTCASTIIMLRPMALWRGNGYVLCAIGLFSVAQWGLSLGVSISVLLIDWRGMIIPCNGVFPNSVHGSPAIIALYFYTLIWDCFILVLTVLGLWRQNAARSTRLWTVLFRQGVGFLVITSAVNILMLVFSWLNLNGTMNILFASPGGSMSVMTSSAAMSSLLTLKESHSRQTNDTHIPHSYPAPILGNQLPSPELTTCLQLSSDENGDYSDAQR